MWGLLQPETGSEEEKQEDRERERERKEDGTLHTDTSVKLALSLSLSLSIPLTLSLSLSLSCIIHLHYISCISLAYSLSPKWIEIMQNEKRRERPKSVDDASAHPMFCLFPYFPLIP